MIYDMKSVQFERLESTGVLHSKRRWPSGYAPGSSQVWRIQLREDIVGPIHLRIDSSGPRMGQGRLVSPWAGRDLRPQCTASTGRLRWSYSPAEEHMTTPKPLGW